MNREIKFRAWHNEWKEMIYSSEPQEPFGKREFYPFEFSVGFSHYPKDDDWKIMQFVGILDKNKIEIFEDDIVKLIILGSNGEIVAQENKIVKYVGCCFEPMNWHNSEYMEVIGNVYQHPELLNTKP